MVPSHLLLLDFHREISVVMLHSYSALSLSKTQTYLKETFPISSSLVLKIFSGSFVSAITFVDQMASGGRFAQICVSSEDADRSFFLSHFGLDL